MKSTLVILAAGMGSRYGGLKQLDQFGPSGETIMEYSVFDAIRAGFSKVVFVIREHFYEDFKERFDAKLSGKIEVEYVFQELNNLPEGYSIPEGREKPWGTGHALLMAKDAVEGDFAMINADDFYGQDAYKQLSSYMSQATKDSEYCMVGFELSKTLTEYGTVSRGVCSLDEEDYLIDVIERTKIGREGDNIFYYEDESKFPLKDNDRVSMNMLSFKNSFFTHLEDGFKAFLNEEGSEMKSEYFVPKEVGTLVTDNKATVKVLSSSSEWFGVTYPEDKVSVQDSISKLVEEGQYPSNLWA